MRLLHPRERIVNQASIEFMQADGLYDDHTYEELLYAYHAAESYWLVSFMDDSTLEDTNANCEEFLRDSQENPEDDEDDKKATALLISYAKTISAIIVKHQLTLGEIIAIFASRRASVAKYMIRFERHPEDPDKPGGIE